MDQAWRDHHHARDQTWRALQIEVALAAGLFGVDVQFKAPAISAVAAALVVLAAFFGILISLHHRKVEVQKFTQIMNFERALELLSEELIPPSSVALPEKLRWWQIFNPRVRHTASFILRMHAAIMAFAMVVLIARLLAGYGA